MSFALSHNARKIVCLIHQVAYVENLHPLLRSNFAIALMLSFLWDLSGVRGQGGDSLMIEGFLEFFFTF